MHASVLGRKCALHSEKSRARRINGGVKIIPCSRENNPRKVAVVSVFSPVSKMRGQQVSCSFKSIFRDNLKTFFVTPGIIFFS